MNNLNKSSRRQFIRHATVAGSGALAGSPLLLKPSPNDVNLVLSQPNYPMVPENQSSQPGEQPLITFARCLAQYRARVYEACKIEENNRFGKMKSYVDGQLSENKPIILVIEDNEDQLFLTRWALLQRFSNAEIVWLSEATRVMPYLESCLQQEQELPQLILVDLYLPDAREGLNVLQRVKSHPVCCRVPAVMLSWSSDAEDIANAFNCSADAYLVKPGNYRDWLSELSLLDVYLNRSRLV
ncbi:hypothetical protein GCM10028819_02790 [Spirosoma humi]